MVQPVSFAPSRNSDHERCSTVVGPEAGRVERQDGKVRWLAIARIRGP